MKCGFTLLEVLLATIVVTVGVAAIIWAFSAGLFAASDAENVETALNIAQAKMEELKDTDFDDLADNGPTADPIFSNFDVEVDVTEEIDDLSKIDVTVTWDTKGGEASVVLTTLRANTNIT